MQTNETTEHTDTEPDHLDYNLGAMTWPQDHETDRWLENLIDNLCGQGRR